MCFSSPSVPSPPPPPPAPAPPPQLPDSGVQSAGTDQRNKAAMAYGASDTILTGPQGLKEQAKTTNKTLLGA